MREVHVKRVVEQVARMCKEANYFLDDEVVMAYKAAVEKEESPIGVEVLEQLIANAKIARDEEVPMCQDTGTAVFFVEFGQEVHLVGGTLSEAINQGVNKGYTEGYLRKSMVSDPLVRKNTGDNTPAIIHAELVPGDQIGIIFAPKGAGSENMSALKMLKPSDGVEGVVNFVVAHVRENGTGACPPLVVGIGIGGNFEKCAYLAKKALMRPLGRPHESAFYMKLEHEILEKVNKLGIGPQGFGGRCTALAVHIETMGCHIASIPVAVNINCHASRHLETVI